MSRLYVAITASWLYGFFAVPTNQDQERTPLPLEHVPIASLNYAHQKRKDGSKKREHEAKETIGAYREIEVIWYHGLLSDKRARQAERADKKASERRRTGI